MDQIHMHLCTHSSQMILRLFDFVLFHFHYFSRLTQTQGITSMYALMLNTSGRVEYDLLIYPLDYNDILVETDASTYTQVWFSFADYSRIVFFSVCQYVIALPN